MSTKPGVALRTRRARRLLDRARNPVSITKHAAERLLEDWPKSGEGAIKQDLATARYHIRQLCLSATRIRRGHNCRILESGDWFIFFRDNTVVTVMHNNSQRRV